MVPEHSPRSFPLGWESCPRQGSSHPASGGDRAVWILQFVGFDLLPGFHRLDFSTLLLPYASINTPVLLVSLLR